MEMKLISTLLLILTLNACTSEPTSVQSVSNLEKKQRIAL